MSCSDEVEPFVRALWDDAMAHAEIDPDSVHLVAVAGAAVSAHVKAACYPPSIELVADPEDLIRGAALTEANLPIHRDKHRIAIYEDIDKHDDLALAVAGATLRHEIRHAEQRDVCGAVLFELDELLDHVNYAKIGGLPRGTLIYHLKPIEMDANAAASTFLRDRFPAMVGAVLESDDAPLARSNTGPGNLDDLPAKTVAQLFTMREVAEAPATFDNSPVPFVNRLRLIDTAAAATWECLAHSLGT